MEPTHTKARPLPEAPDEGWRGQWRQRLARGLGRPAARGGVRTSAGVSLPSTLTLRGVTRRFGSKTALDRVDLQIERSEILCLLGHSGCGKSTLLRVIAGLTEPSEGEVLIDGRTVASAGRTEAPELRGVGMIFQDYALFPHLTLLANVMFGLRKLGRREARRAALAALARVGLAEDAGRYPHQMSGGEQQRVALARAIAPRPGALLMDEPFSGLDKRLRDSVREETLGVLRETRATTVLVTHDPEEAMLMASRIALLRKGRLVQIGTPADVYERPIDMNAARYFSPMTELRTRRAAGLIDLPFAGLQAPARSADGDWLDVGIRPEGVEIVPNGQGVPGRVRSVQFLGEIEAIELAVEGIDRPLLARRQAGVGLRQGQDVGVHLSPRHVLAFKASDA